jgi:AcrR family transcriptional regulator
MSREFVLAHQRERLIRGMVDAIDDKGYIATSVADVLVIARVSRSAFYELFRDKEDCFLACYDEGADLVLEAVGSSLGAGGDWPVRIRRVFTALLGVFVDHPKLARVCMIEALAAGAQANDRYRQAIAGLVSLVETDMSANEDVPRVPRTVLLGLVGGCSAVIYGEIAAGRTAQLREKIEELTAFWLAGFVGYEKIQRTGMLRFGPPESR